ncbi:uncharacterized protein [Antedon mediterranea]|uniref:uncharacterized protein n=1 Tax=Antedon mediterranea TaxID=105859 RepID=UPI003AF71EC4
MLSRTCEFRSTSDIDRGDTAIFDYFLTLEEIIKCKCERCLNGATCIVEDDDVSCECLVCYDGDTCENAYEACVPGLCQNGGVCQSVQNNCEAYTCLCVFPFYGVHCEFDKRDILRRYGYYLTEDNTKQDHE